MYTLRSPRSTDAHGLGRAWDDARAHYSELDPDSYLPPDPIWPVDDWVVSRLVERASDPSGFVLVAADGDDHAVGFVEAEVRDASNTSPHRMARFNAHRRVGIEALFVQRDHWRTGVGRALVDAVEDWAVRQGASTIGLTAHARSTPALSFYEALGYSRAGVVFAKRLGGVQ